MMYHKAPLPFTGQKRFFIQHFNHVIEQHIPHTGRGWTIVDVFGGSGLLAHNAKQLKPDAHVVYNDFDGYTHRLTNLADTERLRQLILNHLNGVATERRLNDRQKQAVIDIIQGFDGYLDNTSIASWLMFSGKQPKTLDDMYQKTFYNCVRKTPYAEPIGYLEGVEIVKRQCYTQLMPQYFDKPNTLFVLDPPYLRTEQASYNQNHYFGMVEFLKLMALTRPPYILFSSNNTGLLDYMAYLEQLNNSDWQRLQGFKHIDIKQYSNYHGCYEDNMLFNFRHQP